MLEELELAAAAVEADADEDGNASVAEEGAVDADAAPLDATPELLPLLVLVLFSAARTNAAIGGPGKT